MEYPEWIRVLFVDESEVPYLSDEEDVPPNGNKVRSGETVYLLRQFDDFIGDQEHLQRFLGYYYAETYGGGPQGGYIFNEAGNVFEVERDWDRPFSASNVSGSIRFYLDDEGQTKCYVV